jgi:hypothetical protein
MVDQNLDIGTRVATLALLLEIEVTGKYVLPGVEVNVGGMRLVSASSIAVRAALLALASRPEARPAAALEPVDAMPIAEMDA